MSEHLKDDIPSKSYQNKSIESRLLNTKNYGTISNDVIPGTLVRKKSQGLLRKDSKKESVWNSISRGLKNN